MVEGFDVTRLRVPQIPPWFGKWRVPVNVRILGFLFKALLRNKILDTQIVQCVGVYPLGVAIAARYESKFVNQTFITQFIGSDFYFGLKKYFQPEKHGSFGLSNLQFNSRRLQDDFTAWVGEQFKANMKVVYRGIPSTGIPTKPINFYAERKIRFLFLGGIQDLNAGDFEYSNFKGIGYLLQAWTSFYGTNKEAVLLIGGPGTEDPNILNHERLRSMKGIEIIGALYPEKVLEQIDDVDVVVIPSLSEGLPNLLNEAQLRGRPVIGTEVGGIPEVLQHRSTGLLVPPKSSSALCDAFRFFYKNPLKIKEYGDQALRDVAQRTACQTYVNGVHSFLKN